MEMSLFASSIRPHLWQIMIDSLKGTTEEIEFVFAGPITAPLPPRISEGNIHFRYITTKNIKPAQIYEVARRACEGELISWTADDAEFPDDVLGKEYRYFKEHCKRKDILSVQTNENYTTWGKCDLNDHRFFPATGAAPKMAPMGVMNREYLQELGGIDRRYICGQWDNDIVMRAYNDGAKMHHFSGACIMLDHKNKHDPKWGVSGDRPFGRGYMHDRNILESAWGRRRGEPRMQFNVIPYARYDTGFEPFQDEDIMTKSQSFTMKELWND